MSGINQPLLQAYYPSTFQERGVAVPFTAPMLSGARLRLTRTQVIEYLLPNPSGGRGVYIVDWSGVRQFCHPTVHDTLLQKRLANQPALTPATMRQTARQLAAEGFAGPAAIQPAIAADHQEQAATEQARQMLLDSLVKQLLPGTTAANLPPAGADARARQAIMVAGAQLGSAPETLARGLTALARSFAVTGLDPPGEPVRLAGQLAHLAHLRKSVIMMAAMDPFATGVTQDVAAAVAVTLSCAESLIRITRAATGNILTMLGQWMAAPGETLQFIQRLDWLLDGWSRLCLLWDCADQAAHRRAAIMEIAQLVPILPPEVQLWTGRQLPASALQPGWRVVSMDDGWRNGSAAFEMIARNERVRALNA